MRLSADGKSGENHCTSSFRVWNSTGCRLRSWNAWVLPLAASGYNKLSRNKKVSDHAHLHRRPTPVPHQRRLAADGETTVFRGLNLKNSWNSNSFEELSCAESFLLESNPINSYFTHFETSFREQPPEALQWPRAACLRWRAAQRKMRRRSAKRLNSPGQVSDHWAHRRSQKISFQPILSAFSHFSSAPPFSTSSFVIGWLRAAALWVTWQHRPMPFDTEWRIILQPQKIMFSLVCHRDWCSVTWPAACSAASNGRDAFA